MSKATDFYDSLNGKKVAFIGAGVSHKTLIKMFSEYGANVTLCDKKTLDKFKNSVIIIVDNEAEHICVLTLSCVIERLIIQFFVLLDVGILCSRLCYYITIYGGALKSALKN